MNLIPTGLIPLSQTAGRWTVNYDQAVAWIQAARSVDEAKGIEDKAEALKVYARLMKDAEMEACLAAIKLRATKRIGELSAELPKDPGGRPPKTLATGGESFPTKKDALKAAGISLTAARRAETIAGMPYEEFENYIETKRAKNQPVTLKECYSKIVRALRKAAKKAELAARPHIDFPVTLRNWTCADALEEIPAESVDLLITDPPYPEEFLPLYDLLARVAEHVLKPGGSLLCMTGQSYLPQVHEDLGRYLTYQWTLAYLTPGGQAVQVFPVKVNTFWKPVLWYVKGDYEGDWIGDVVRSKTNDNDKDHHEWGQSESGMRDLMTRFVRPTNVVLDPFMGAGTTGVIALELGAKFIGYDVSEEHCKTAAMRMGHATVCA